MQFNMPRAIVCRAVAADEIYIESDRQRQWAAFA
jgi:hypothetical protein